MSLGYVRDYIMKRPFKNDVDIVVVGSGIEFATLLGDRLHTKVAVSKFWYSNVGL
jgi:tRNA nucleotidyltransferase/poly(A) polymerase